MLLVTLLLVAQSFVPGQRLEATCAGQWATVTTSATAIAADCEAVPEPPPPGNLRIVVGHLDVDLFARVPMASVQALRVMSVDRSVGYNISQGVGVCLPAGSGAAPTFCRRWAWTDGSYPSPPMTWTPHALPTWTYYNWPNSYGAEPQLPCVSRTNKMACWAEYVDATAGQWDVVSAQPSYLDAASEISVADYLATYEALKVRHPNLVIMLHTASLAREIGRAANHAFNEAVRAHVAAHGGVLIDIADIETYDPYGTPWFYNGYPVIAPHYTSEKVGGHLQSPSAGMIRIAQAWWVALGQIAGWRP